MDRRQRLLFGNVSPLASGDVDPYYSSVVFLAQWAGADGSTTFTDEKGHALTGAGNAQIDTAFAPAGMTSSLLLDGTGDYITALDSADWALGSGDFTIEAFVRFVNNGQDGNIIGQVQNLAVPSGAWNIFYNPTSGSNILRFYNNATFAFFNAPFTPVDGDWNHIIISRAANNWYWGANGAQLATMSNAAALPDAALELAVGAVSVTHNFGLNGSIGPVRITKGVSRYGGGNYVVPTLPFPTV